MEDNLVNKLIARYEDIKLSIQEISKKSLFNNSVTLVVVAKGRSLLEIETLIKLGHIDFAENYINSQIFFKWMDLKNRYPQIKIHFIGNIQNNKINKILEMADFVHSVDNFKTIDSILKKNSLDKKIFLQIKFDENENRSGIFYKNLEEYIFYCKKNNFDVSGLMVILPIGYDINLLFSFVKYLSFEYNLQNLSMGMTEDYKDAILNGANYVRIGRKIFEEC